MSRPIPATVPHEKIGLYQKNYIAITRGKERLFLFAADQKMEHMNDDFYAQDLPSEVNDPHHIFTLASDPSIGAFASHAGLISLYGPLYPSINYIVKLNGKTNLTDGDPLSSQLWTVHDVIQMKINSNLRICGVGYTVYLGSDYEHAMLKEAASIVQAAHEQGLLAILWIYPRGHAVHAPYDPHVIAGAAGVGASLGADFIKVHAPQAASVTLQEAVVAASVSHVIVSGGPVIDPVDYVKIVYSYMHEGKVSGIAVGRNIFQHNKKVALALANALSYIVYENCNLSVALDILRSNS